MKNINKIKDKFISCICKIAPYLGRKGLVNWIEDEFYLKCLYRALIGKKMNVSDPKTYNEKLQWIKINDRNPLYTKLVDKYEVREYISKIIGSEYLIPLLGVWDSFEDIDFNRLPEKFVLKCTHDSGGLVICNDKKQLDLQKAKIKINKSLKRNYFYWTREWPYKNVKPRIICEKYMVDDSGIELRDYKFMCFNGEPKIVQYHTGRFTEHKQFHYDINGNLLPFNNLGYTNDGAPDLDMNIVNKMIPLAKKLAKGLIQVRIDFYFINNKVYFGEITFFDGAGFEKIEPEEYDYLLGSWIDLNTY